MEDADPAAIGLVAAVGPNIDEVSVVVADLPVVPGIAFGVSYQPRAKLAAVLLGGHFFEAFMQLILTNTQGEMSPLEEGHHAHFFAERNAHGGRNLDGSGRSGGLREYARRLNKAESVLRERRSAYVAYSKCADSAQLDYGLYLELSKASSDAMIRPLAAAAANHKWSRKEIATKVAEVGKFTVPSSHAPWLPPGLVVESYLRDGRPGPGPGPVSSALERSVRAMLEVGWLEALASASAAAQEGA